MLPRYKRLQDMSEQNTPKPEGISLLPNVLDLAKAMEVTATIEAAGLDPATGAALMDPDPTGPIPVPAKPKAKSKPKPKTTVATTPIVSLPQASGAVISVSPGMAISMAGVGGKSMAELIASGIYPVTLPSPLHARLLKPAAGVGGWQTLMGQLKECTLPDVPVCMLPRDLMLSMIPKAVVHGSGGYQGVIRWLLCLVLEQHQGALLAPATK